MFSQATRRLSTSVLRRTANEDIHPAYLRIKETQKEYQVNNGRLIHERHGNWGKVLQTLTGIFFVASTVQTGMFLSKLLRPLFVRE